MIQKFPDGKLIIETTIPDYDSLLTYMGFAVGSALRIGNKLLARDMIALLNRMNMGNPDFIQYNLDTYYEDIQKRWGLIQERLDLTLKQESQENHEQESRENQKSRENQEDDSNGIDGTTGRAS